MAKDVLLVCGTQVPSTSKFCAGCGVMATTMAATNPAYPKGDSFLKHRLVIAFVVLASFDHLVAASFDCGKARTRTEKLICSDDGLSKADEEMAAAYKNARQLASQFAPEDAKEIKEGQVEWLTDQANNCTDRQCLVDAYKARNAELAFYVSHLKNDAADYTGTYSMGQRGHLEVIQLSSGLIKFSLQVTRSVNLNSGEASGEIRLNRGVAVYTDPGDAECKITMVFRKTKVLITQSGSCGFGYGVIADGTYMKTSDSAGSELSESETPSQGSVLSPKPDDSGASGSAVATSQPHVPAAPKSRVVIPHSQNPVSTDAPDRTAFLLVGLLLFMAMALVVGLVKPSLVVPSGFGPTRMKAGMLYGTLALIATVCLASQGPRTDPPKTAPEDSSKPASPSGEGMLLKSYESPDLVQEYAKNAIRADHKLKGTRIRVIGSVVEIGKDDDGAPYVGLNGASDDSLVKCTFDEDQSAALAKLDRGARVALIGTMTGLTTLNVGDVGVAGRVDLDRCEVSQDR